MKRDSTAYQWIQLVNVNPLPHADAFDTFANRADLDQASVVRAADHGLLCLIIEI